MSLDKNGQASAELIFVTLIFLVIAGGLLQLGSSEMSKADTGNLAQARMIGESIAETINTVYTNGPGYSANLTLPNFTNSTASYNVHVYSDGSSNNFSYLNMSYNGNNMTIKLIPTSVQSFSMSNGQTHVVTNNNSIIQFT